MAAAMLVSKAHKSWEWMARKWQQVDEYVVDQWLRGWTPADVGDLRGKVFMVTGANSGIGYHTSRKLAENGAKVYMVVRSLKRGELAAANIRAQVGKDAQLVLMEYNHDRLQNMVQLAKDFLQTKDPLHCLICNAGVFHPGPFAKTEDGLEQTLAINYFAPALLTLLLLPRIRETKDSRIVWEASTAEQFGKLDFSNLRGTHYKNSGLYEYGASKLYMLMFCRELNARVPDLDVLCVQPGLVLTPLQTKVDRRYFTGSVIVAAAFLIGQKEYHGSWSTIFAATEPSLSGKRFSYIGPNTIGQYHHVRRRPSNRVAENPISCWKLFEETARILRASVGKEAATLLQVPPHLDAPSKGRIRSGRT